MPAPQFTLLAGVEITRGEVGTLRHGSVDPHHTWGDPVAAARRWLQSGATWLHVADLDAATGVGSNTAAVTRVVQAARGHAHVQLAGGIRDDATLGAALALRPTRIVLDTAALADGDWVEQVIARHGDLVAVELTAHGTRLSVPGSPLDGTDAGPVVDRLRAANCRAVVATDVDAEGARRGTDRHLLALVCQHLAHAHVVSGGGVAHLNDLHHLMDLVPKGLDAAVLDHALYTDAFTFAEAVAAAEPRFDLFFWGPPQP